ncbi:MAG: hypothetical protein LKJ48_01535 [Lactobacillus sp.]|jgi:hypothetical protein|nr:hypothetical protein [Lactobacillus sp.]
MPFLLIPIFLIVIGLVILMIIALVFGLIQVLFWPAVIGLLVWWVVRRSGHAKPAQRRHHGREHSDWQTGLHQRKEAHNVHEETQRSHHDDWSDF